MTEKEEYKELRVNIDALYQLTKELKPLKGVNYANIYVEENSKQIEDAAHSLIYAKAWLGKVLGELGSKNPYGSGYKTVEDIIPTQDVAKLDVFTNYEEEQLKLDYKESSHIEKVDWLRAAIEKQTKRVLPSHPNAKFQLRFLYEQKAHEHLCEARFALGFEMERIKNA